MLQVIRLGRYARLLPLDAGHSVEIFEKFNLIAGKFLFDGVIFDICCTTDDRTIETHSTNETESNFVIVSVKDLYQYCFNLQSSLSKCMTLWLLNLVLYVLVIY